MAISRVIIDAAPAVRPTRFGLASVADVKDAGDPHILGGFSYETQCSHGTGFAADPCTGLSGVSGGGVGPYPASVTITSEIKGDYVIQWGDGTGNTTVANTGAPTTTNHNYATTGAKTVTVVGPLGYGTRTMSLTAGGAATAPVGVNPTKAALPGLSTVYGDRLAIFALHRCRMPGITRVEAQKRAVDGLNRSESHAIEDAVYDRYLAAATDIGGAATTPARALAILENYAAVNYTAEPVIHADRFIASLLTLSGLVKQHGNRLETELGTGIAAGTGYSVHPEPSPAFIFATGAVVIRKGTSEVHGAPKMNPADNEEVWLAERPMSIAVECFAVKVAVTTT